MIFAVYRLLSMLCFPWPPQQYPGEVLSASIRRGLTTPRRKRVHVAPAGMHREQAHHARCILCVCLSW